MGGAPSRVRPAPSSSGGPGREGSGGVDRSAQPSENLNPRSRRRILGGIVVNDHDEGPGGIGRMAKSNSATSRREQRKLQHQDISRTQLLDAAEEVFGQ